MSLSLTLIVADAYIGTEAATQTYTKTWQTDVLLKKLGIQKTAVVDAALRKPDIQETFAVDSAFSKRIETQKQFDTLFKKLGILKALVLTLISLNETY